MYIGKANSASSATNPLALEPSPGLKFLSKSFSPTPK